MDDDADKELDAINVSAELVNSACFVFQRYYLSDFLVASRPRLIYRVSLGELNTWMKKTKTYLEYLGKINNDEEINNFIYYYTIMNWKLKNLNWRQ